MPVEILPERLDKIRDLKLLSGGHEPPNGEVEACVMEGRIAERLKRRSLVRPSGCIEWVGHTDTRSGHGAIRVNGRIQKVHRVAFQLACGPIPDGMCVCHHCDNPPCINPAHLFLGSVRDNNQDRAAKGRSKGVFVSGDAHPARMRAGEGHWCAKLSSADVRQIRVTPDPPNQGKHWCWTAISQDAPRKNQ